MKQIGSKNMHVGAAMRLLILSALCAWPGASQTITRIYPKTLKTNTDGSINITGTGFDLKATVSINGGTPITPTANTATTIALPVKAANIPVDGRYDMVVINPGPPAVSSNTFSFEASSTGVSGLNLVLGVGTLLSGNHTNYTVNSSTNVLQTSNIGAATPQLLTGVSFRLPIAGFSTKTHLSVRQPWDAFVSLKFAPGTTQTLNGFVFGASYRVASHLGIMAGYALSPNMEPSPGFINAAVAAVQKNPTQYPNFNASTLAANGQNAFDGFPLLQQPLPSGSSSSTNANLYAGNPLGTHYRGGLILGITIPVSVGQLLGTK